MNCHYNTGQKTSSNGLTRFEYINSDICEVSMKIGILTHYNVSSHGALLQMYCLKRILEDMNHEVYILSFNRNYDFIDSKTRQRFSASIKNAKYYLCDYTKQYGLGVLPYQYKKQHVLSAFRTNNFKILPYTESNSLDYVIVGADEVFSLENGINIMMFGHCITSKHIISYAPSFGQTDIDRIRKFGCEQIIKSGLELFDHISVRDEGSQIVVEELTGKKPEIVCDPALLYDFGRKESERDKYIVVYSYQSNFDDPQRIHTIREYAKENNLKIWSVGVYYRWCDRQINCDPLEMIDVFSKAQAIITDTFHGTITSYIARTPMAIFVRKENNVKLDYLIQCLGLTDRKVTQNDELKIILSKPLLFERIDSSISSIREKSMNYLISALN